MQPRDHSIEDMLKTDEVSHLFDFFRDDVPDNTKYDIIVNLLYDEGVRHHFQSDAQGDNDVTFDITNHVPGHVWGFVQGYGVPVYDLGFCFWLGKDLDKVLGSLESELNQALTGDKNYTIPSEKRESVDAQWRETQDYVATLKRLDRNLPVSELIQTNPEPRDILSYAGSRFSFFLFYLAFHRNGEKTSETYERRAQFSRELSILLEKLIEDSPEEKKLTEIQAYKSWVDEVYDKSWGDVSDARVQDVLTKGKELYHQQRGGGNTRENYVLERLAMHLAFGIREETIREQKNIEQIVGFLSSLTEEEFLPLKSASLYALEIIGKKGYGEAFDLIRKQLQKGLPRAIQHVSERLIYLLE